MEGGQAVDGEGLGVEVLLGIGRRAAGGGGPDHAAVVGIDQAPGGEAAGMGRRVQERRILQRLRGLREEPEDPGLQHRPLVGGPDRLAGGVGLAGEAAGGVAQGEPERDQPVEFGLGGAGQAVEAVGRGHWVQRHRHQPPPHPLIPAPGSGRRPARGQAMAGTQDRRLWRLRQASATAPPRMLAEGAAPTCPGSRLSPG